MARGVSALNAELREKADGGLKALLDGVELTERELHKALEKHGVRKFDPLGARNLIPTCIRRCSKCLIRPGPPAPSPR